MLGIAIVRIKSPHHENIYTIVLLLVFVPRQYGLIRVYFILHFYLHMFDLFYYSAFSVSASSSLSFTLVCVSPPNPIINHGLHHVVVSCQLPSSHGRRQNPRKRSTNIIYIIIQQLITKKTMTKFDILQVISSAVALAIITAGNDGNVVVRAFTAPVGGGRRPSSTAGG